MTSAAKGLEQMGVGLAVLMETKLTDDRFTRLALGFKILASKATSHNQGGIALLWKENHPGYEVESARIAMPNLLTFQLVTGDERLYCMGIYIPHRHDGGGRSSGCLGSLSRGLHPPHSGRPEY